MWVFTTMAIASISPVRVTERTSDSLAPSVQSAFVVFSNSILFSLSSLDVLRISNSRPQQSYCPSSSCCSGGGRLLRTLLASAERPPPSSAKKEPPQAARRSAALERRRLAGMLLLVLVHVELRR